MTTSWRERLRELGYAPLYSDDAADDAMAESCSTNSGR